MKRIVGSVNSPRDQGPSRSDYVYALHSHTDGRETKAHAYPDRDYALIAFEQEVGTGLAFVEDGQRSGSHTLKRFRNVRGRPGELLETFLVQADDR
jgi:hypothetical protein